MPQIEDQNIPILVVCGNFYGINIIQICKKMRGFNMTPPQSLEGLSL